MQGSAEALKVVLDAYGPFVTMLIALMFAVGLLAWAWVKPKSSGSDDAKLSREWMMRNVVLPLNTIHDTTERVEDGVRDLHKRL